MRRRLPSLVGISALFLALGCLDLYRGLAPLVRSPGSTHMAPDDLEVTAVGVAALVGGVFLLYGHRWARWLLAAWMALHVALSIGDVPKLLAHAVIFGTLTFFLFRPRAAAHFG